MSKRAIERHGRPEDPDGMMDGPPPPDDKPRQATAAQMAHRKILQAKGKGSARTSRQGSPAVAPSSGANPFQSFQPPPSAGGFNFSIPGAPSAPTFGGGGGGVGGGGAPAQPNGTPSFGGFGGASSTNNTPAFGSGFGASQPPSQPQVNGFAASATPSFSFGQNQSTASSTTTPSASFAFGQTAPSQDQPKTNGFKPSTSFSFGAPPPAQQPQPSGPTTSFSFGQTQKEPPAPKPSPPSFGGFGQPAQANGDKPPGTGLFGAAPASAGDQPPKSSGSIFGGLNAATNGVKPGAFTPSPANSEPAAPPPPAPANPFASFGSAQQHKEQETPKPTPTPSFSFGQQPNQQKTEPTTTTPSFAGFGQPPAAASAASSDGDKAPSAANPFGGFKFGQPAASEQEKPSEKSASPFKFGSAPEQPTPKPASSNIFGGASQEQPTPKPTSNIFGGVGQEQPASKPASNIFSTAGQEQQTPKPASNIFSGAAQEQQTPKPTSNIFGHAPSSQAPKSTPGFRFGAQNQEDTSMSSPGNTPQKPHPAPAPTQPEQPSKPTEPETPAADATAGKSLFERLSHDPPATAPRPSFSFGQTASSSNAPTATPGKSLFAPSEPAAPPATAPRPSATPFGPSAPSSAPAPPPFTASTPAQPPAAPKPAPAQLPPQTSPDVPASSTSSSGLSADRTRLKELNEGLLAHLKTQDPAEDWSVIFQYYMSEAAKLMGDKAFKAPSAGNHQAAASSTTPSTVGGNAVGTSSSKPTAPSSNAVSAQAPPPPGQSSHAPPSNAPATPSAGNIFAQAAKPPATTPANKKRRADEDLTQESQTRPRLGEKVEYPKLPETASKTAHLFASTLEKADKSSRNFGPPPDVYAKVQEQKAAKEAARKAESEKSGPPAATSGFNPSTTFKFGATPKATESATDKPVEAPKPPTFGFTPSSSTSPAPTAGGFRPPSFAPAGGSNSFLSAFGKKAEAEQVKKKKERMDDDYESDEEDKAAWEARYKAEQEATRRKIEDAAKSGPTFALSAVTDKRTPSTPFAFKPAGNDKPAEEPAQSDAGKSLFSRITPADQSTSSSQPSIFSTQMPAKPTFTPSTFSFSQSKTPDASKKTETAPTGNGSTTPAAAPPGNPFAGLFGSKSTPATKPAGSEPGKLAPPSVGFSFGAPKGASTDGSRATTPGATTDGERSNAETGDDNEPSEEQNDKQIEDMTALLPEERESEDVLFELPIAKASKIDDKKTESGDMTKGWVEKGKGPLYILKHKATGKTRVLLKIPPLGRPAMNFGPIKGAEYKVPPGKKFMRGEFVDHLEPSKEKAGKISSWMVQVKEAKDAEEMARILTEAKGSS